MNVRPGIILLSLTHYECKTIYKKEKENNMSGYLLAYIFCFLLTTITTITIVRIKQGVYFL